MSNPKNIFKNILAGLFILLLTICPASAAATADTTSVDQTLKLIMPEAIGLSVTPSTLQFTSSFSSGKFYQVATANVANVGNVNTNIFYQLKSNFTNGNIILNPSQYDYTVSSVILLYGQQYLIREMLEPSQSYEAYHALRFSQIPPMGIYTANATYTAMKAA